MEFLFASVALPFRDELAVSLVPHNGLAHAPDQHR